MSDAPVRPKAVLTLWACILSSSLVGIDGVMTPVALPEIARDFGVGLVVQQWVVAACMLALGSLLLVGGALGDAYNRWRVFGIGTAAYAAASLVSALAPNATVLIGGRFLQGMAAALVVPGALSIITTTFAGAERSKAIGTWTAWSGVSVIVGPAIGGALVGTVGWRAVYGVLVVLSLLVLYLIVRAAPANVAQEPSGKVDVAGALLAVPIVGGPVFAFIQGPSIGWANPLVVGGFVAGVLAAVTFVWWERRAPSPLVPFELFGNRTFTMLNVVTFVLYAALICTGVYVILFLQQTAGYGPIAAGLSSVIPMMVLFVLAKPIGSLADRLGTIRPFIAGGSLLVAASVLLLLRTDGDADFFTVVLPWGLAHGVGLSLVVSPLTAGVLSSADERHAGAASGVNNAVARVGSLFGVAVVGMLISVQFSSGLHDELDNDDLSPSAHAAISASIDRPLDVAVGDAVADGDVAVVELTLTEASVDAFRFGVGAIALLALLGSVLAFVGIDRSRPKYSAAGANGGCLFGTHEDHPASVDLGERGA